MSEDATFVSLLFTTGRTKNAPAAMTSWKYPSPVQSNSRLSPAPALNLHTTEALQRNIIIQTWHVEDRGLINESDCNDTKSRKSFVFPFPT